MHPLVLHAAVVFVPLAALGLILMAIVPKFGARFGWVVSATAAVALAASWISRESGEQLEKLIGEPGFDHAEWGDRMPVVAGVLLAMTVILWLAQRSWAKRRASGKDGGSGLIAILGIVSVLVAGASMFMIYKTGDTGAKSVWEAEIAAVTSGSDQPTAEPTGTASPAATATQESPSPTSTDGTASPSASAGTATYTAADVAEHNSSGDCWTSINGKVYDVTAWENEHPGGAARIIQLCGIDGTSLFDGQHEGEPKPEDILAGYQIGVLG